ncbi:MAG: hypothetical protein A2782_02190 [Candidatus Blackburnbacteria bacterium RIFCSPHIGHO2_01_FULL_43_15b]|uniref:Uncharacterized protein n=1 Tax=Candidatus Blackburnbacteria bacterium RIFCSPHIGHO2_01_FULL_43_15b TaxID=1797513 RepID=A0A1G1V0C1_9BACT|nr:MAG: hypothetical protein A2782_02190 [Candidatus Blackburnbacteria bacterium RIFCSPHIGHO2_01_FULL_43_15b]
MVDSQIDQPGGDKVYQEMYKKIEGELKQGNSVAHDTGNFTKEDWISNCLRGKRSLDLSVVLLYISNSQMS